MKNQKTSKENAFKGKRLQKKMPSKENAFKRKFIERRDNLAMIPNFFTRL
jgi:hypothetical protein